MWSSHAIIVVSMMVLYTASNYFEKEAKKSGNLAIAQMVSNGVEPIKARCAIFPDENICKTLDK